MNEDTKQYLLMVLVVIIPSIPAAYTVLVMVMHDIHRRSKDNGRR